MSKKYYSGGEEIASKEYVDTEIGSIDLSAYEEVVNKVLSLSSSSTDTQYPSAKAVFDLVSGLNPIVTPATSSDRFNFTTAKAGYYVSTNTSDFYYYVQGDYHTNRPIPFFVLTKNIADAVYQETFGYGLYFEKNAAYEGGIGLVRFEKYNNTYINVYYNQLTLGVNGNAQTWYGVKTFCSTPKLNSYTAPTQDVELTAKKYVDDQLIAKAVQYSTMPTASADTVGNIVQYIGATGEYTQGYFYMGTETTEENDGVETTTYSWENMPVQDGDGNLNLHWIWQGYPDDSVGIIDFSAMSRGIYLLSNLFCYRNGSAGSITYKKKNGSTTNLTIDTGGTAFNYASRAIYITMPVSEISSTSSFGVIGSIDIVDLTDGTVHNRRLKYYPSDGTVAFTKETKTPVIHYLTEVAQTITGVKTFDSIPQVSSYTAPTTDVQLTAKKYVDDAISVAVGNINSVLATLTTPSNGGGN